jgi:caffeoyl-CoA O-methyltransferase
VARAVGEGGKLIACDVNEEWTGLARRYWAEAGLEDRIELRIGPALDTLAELRGGELFDFAYIDADKPSYPAYWEAVVELVRPDGLIVLDNVLYGGEVVAKLDGGDRMRPYMERGERNESLEGILKTNALVAADPRVESVMLGVADGITIARRRGEEEA